MGNLEPMQRGELLAGLRASLRPGEHLLLGTDLVKDRDRMLAAYNDSAGVTAAFNRNVLSVLNAELDADFEPELWSHEAVYDARMERIEMRLRTDVAQHVSICAIDLTFEAVAGDHIRTETSAKFRRTGVDMELTRAGFAMEQWWTDPAGDFAVSLSRAS
jgi:L-histidine N-alpha-methyltransferase